MEQWQDAIAGWCKYPKDRRLLEAGGPAVMGICLAPILIRVDVRDVAASEDGFSSKSEDGKRCGINMETSENQSPRAQRSQNESFGGCGIVKAAIARSQERKNTLYSTDCRENYLL